MDEHSLLIRDIFLARGCTTLVVIAIRVFASTANEEFQLFSVSLFLDASCNNIYNQV